jgi:hypothetical protein
MTDQAEFERSMLARIVTGEMKLKGRKDILEQLVLAARFGSHRQINEFAFVAGTRLEHSVANTQETTRTGVARTDDVLGPSSAQEAVPRRERSGDPAPSNVESLARKPSGLFANARKRAHCGGWCDLARTGALKIRAC